MRSSARIVFGDRRWAVFQYVCHGFFLSRASRSGMVAMVKRPGSRLSDSSGQVSGVDTGASGRARVE
jgi:hypothetical protein